MGEMFKDRPQINWLPDGKRLQMRHGPIDLIISADGEGQKQAYRQAARAFDGLLGELAGELGLLRTAINDKSARPKGQVAINMWLAAKNLGAGKFTTPMIAVAGAVADQILEAMCDGTNLTRAYVNNGGDIALYLADGKQFEVGVCANPEIGSIASKVTILSSDNISGIATSGWHGRSHSLGIADAVTILAKTAAEADAAATLIANAVDFPGHVAISRRPANELSPDSDLGAKLVTTGVARLDYFDAQTAMENGKKLTQKLLDKGLIDAAYIVLQSESTSLSRIGDKTRLSAHQSAEMTRSFQSKLEPLNA